jgi:hypothetical protein
MRRILHLHWENLFLIFVFGTWLVIAKHKEISADRVSMHIAKKENLTRLQSSFHHLLRVEVYWILFLLGIRPLSIQIGAH